MANAPSESPQTAKHHTRRIPFVLKRHFLYAHLEYKYLRALDVGYSHSSESPSIHAQARITRHNIRRRHVFRQYRR